jgi:ribose transport system ATP-binding protein
VRPHLDDTSAASGPTALSGREQILVVDGVSKRYDAVQAVANLGLSLGRGEVLGLVGENGAGKSTLLGILNGNVVPDAGSVTIRGEPLRFGHPSEASERGIATVYQEQGLVPTLTVYENMFLGRESHFAVAGVLRRRALISSASKILDALRIDVDPTAYTGELTFAERQLVEIGKAFALTEAFNVEPIILLDEPTSALSAEEIDLLFENMRGWRERASFIFVSHRLAHVLAVCDRVAALKDGELIGEVAAAETDESALHELIVGRKRDRDYYKEDLQVEAREQLVLRARGLGHAQAFSDISLDLREGEILGVAGVAGCGKSELARALAGLEPFRRGTLEVFGRSLRSGATAEAIRRGVAYVPAERNREGVIAIHTVAANMTLPLLSRLAGPTRVLLDARAARVLVDEWIARLNIKTPSRDTPMGSLSGGNQQKVVFAKWLARRVRILVLDDPGRGLDVGAKEEIYGLLRALAGEGVATLLVSDNLPELIGLSHRVLTMRGGVLTAEIATPREAKPAETDVVRHMV